jgi:hypothetical protein
LAAAAGAVLAAAAASSSFFSASASLAYLAFDASTAALSTVTDGASGAGTP